MYWLSRIICAEAGGESLAGQVAVGNVVLNRVDSDEFPNTIHEVIFDRKHAVQFEPVSNGTVYNEPTETSVQAAKLALQGVNTAGKSLYFFNMDRRQPGLLYYHRMPSILPVSPFFALSRQRLAVAGNFYASGTPRCICPQ